MIFRSTLQTVQCLGTMAACHFGLASRDDKILAAMIAWLNANQQKLPDVQRVTGQLPLASLKGRFPSDAQRQAVISSVAAMPPLTLAILALHVHHAMRVAEISQRFGIGHRQVRGHIRMAIRKIAHDHISTSADRV